MNRYRAVEILCKVINSGILSDELEEEFNELIDSICEKDFEPCPKECLRYCKLDECQHTES